MTSLDAKLQEILADLQPLPEGWKIEPILHTRLQAILTCPPPTLYATIDFDCRGFRGGYCVTGKFVGEKLLRSGKTQRKQYDGRGWKQALVNDAVAYLEKVRR